MKGKNMSHDFFWRAVTAPGWEWSHGVVTGRFSIFWIRYISPAPALLVYVSGGIPVGKPKKIHPEAADQIPGGGVGEIPKKSD